MLIIGAKGFAKQLLDILVQTAMLDDLAFYDDISSDIENKLYHKFPILRNITQAKEYFEEKSNIFALGIGNPHLRYKVYQRFTSIGGQIITIISPLSRIAIYDVHIAEGVNILTGSVIENSVTINRGTLINLNCMITHDCKIGQFCELSPGVIMGGASETGDFCSIGSGAIILPKIRLGDNVTVGAGAVVTKDIPHNSTVIGVPAKPLLKP
jgi:sugar O-acyltransferase (sialic acid O-acetyltransferase NeuD family)